MRFKKYNFHAAAEIRILSAKISQYKSMEKVNKRTALVVGGSSGIGFETCCRLAGRGWNVVNISRTPCKNSKVTNISADVAKKNELPEAIFEAGEKFNISALVYSAGFSMAAPIEFARDSDVRYLFDVNFFGALSAMQNVIPYFKGRGGRIVLVGSVGGELPICFDSFYSASKSALEMLARAAYSELKTYNIHVTAVLPGGTATEFTFKRKIYTDEENKGYSKKVNRAVAALANIEQGGASPASVAEDIYTVLTEDKPPVIKTCGIKNGAYVMLSRMMPQKLTLVLNERMYNQ